MISWCTSRTVGLEVDGSDERVVRQVGVEQGAVVVVGAPAGGRLRRVRARCIQDDGAQLRAGMRIRCASHRIDAHQGDSHHRQRRQSPRYYGEPESPRSLSHVLRLAHGVRGRRSDHSRESAGPTASYENTMSLQSSMSRSPFGSSPASGRERAGTACSALLNLRRMSRQPPCR